MAEIQGSCQNQQRPTENYTGILKGRWNAVLVNAGVGSIILVYWSFSKYTNHFHIFKPLSFLSFCLKHPHISDELNSRNLTLYLNEIAECIIILCKQQENVITVNYNKKHLGKNSSLMFCFSCSTRSRAASLLFSCLFLMIIELLLQLHVAHLHLKRKKSDGKVQAFFPMTRNTKGFPKFPLRRIIPMSYWPEACHMTITKGKKYWESM